MFLLHNVLCLWMPGCLSRMIDVGGQIHERVYWEAEYHNLLACIFVVNLAEYDDDISINHQGKRCNKFFEAFELFKDVATHPKNEGTPFVVLLNKCDLFQEQLRGGITGLSYLFPEVPPENDFNYNYACEYIGNYFCSVKRKAKNIYFVTKATDTSLIRDIFSELTAAVSDMNIRSAGLVLS